MIYPRGCHDHELGTVPLHEGYNWGETPDLQAISLAEATIRTNVGSTILNWCQ